MQSLKKIHAWAQMKVPLSIFPSVTLIYTYGHFSSKFSQKLLDLGLSLTYFFSLKVLQPLMATTGGM